MGAAPEITEHDPAGVCVLSVSGDLDLDAAVVLCARIDAARRSHCRRVLLDLGELRDCDGRGVRALLRAADEVFADGGRVAAVPPHHSAAAHMFALAGASEIVPVHDSVGEGVTALTSAVS
jgi:anti-anti-sigma factor